MLLIAISYTAPNQNLYFSAVLEDVRNKVFIYSKPILCMVSALAKPPTPSSRKTGTWHPVMSYREVTGAVPEGL